MSDTVRCKNIVEAIRCLEPGHVLTQCLERDGIAVNYQRNTLVRMPDGRTAILCLSGSFNFYRGENRLYDSCRSSLYRIKGRKDRIRALARTYEFMLFLETLPEVQFYIQNNLWYDPWALAQHYEFATPMIDLTNEIAVAAFFATHRYDRVAKRYMLMKEGTGRIRRLFSVPGLQENDPLTPIGVQPFSRPGNQYGYGCWLPEDGDLKDFTQSVEFEQDYEVNLRLKSAATGPETIYFPDEKIARMAAVIRSENVVTNAAVDRFASEAAKGILTPAPGRDEIIAALEEKGTCIVDAPVICPEAMPDRGRPLRYERKIVMKPAYWGQRL